MEAANIVIFEMPSNDLIRTGLRFEYLKQFADKYLSKKTELDSIVCMDTLIDMLHLLDRPELRSKYFQEFSRFGVYLERLQHTQNIDAAKLQHIIEKLTVQMEKLNKHNGKFANELREHFFIKNLLQFSDKPAGLCGYNTPEYLLWLHQSGEARYNDLKNWLSSFEEITDTNQVFLHLIRGSGKQTHQTAHDGFYQQAIDPKVPCQLVQVRISKELETFPRISIGKHNISIVFLKSHREADAEAEKDHRDLDFELVVCAL